MRKILLSILIFICYFSSNAQRPLKINRYLVDSLVNSYWYLYHDSTHTGQWGLVSGSGGGSSTIETENVLYVAKNGSNTTGERNNLGKPYLTIRAALNAATTGDAIVVYPGTYEETTPISLAKSVNYVFLGKGELQLNTSVSTGSVFTDSSTVCYANIWGAQWKFTGRSSQKVLEQTAASNVEVVVDSIICSTGKNINTSGGAHTKVKSNYLFSNSFAGNIWLSASGSFYGDIDEIEADEFGNTVWISNVPSFVLHSKKLHSDNAANADYLVHIADCNATDSIYFDVDELYSQTEWAFWAEGDSKNVFLNTQRISANSDCVVVSFLINSGMLTVKASVIENRTTGAMDGIVHGEGGNMTVIGARIVRQAGATGADVLTSNHGGLDGAVKLIAVSYDITKVTEVTPGTITRIDNDFYSGITIGASLSQKYTSTATGITLSSFHCIVEVTATGQTITLPTAVGITGRIYTIKLTASGSCTIATTSSQNIDASTTYSLSAQYKYVTVVSNNVGWLVIANN